MATWMRGVGELVTPPSLGGGKGGWIDQGLTGHAISAQAPAAAAVQLSCLHVQTRCALRPLPAGPTGPTRPILPALLRSVFDSPPTANGLSQPAS